jgi:hypothetical protein
MVQLMNLRFLARGLLVMACGVLARASAQPSAGPSEFDRPAAVSRFAYEFTAGQLGWRTSGPFTGITKSFRENPIPYRITVAAVSVAHPVTTRGGFWRNFEFVHSAVWSSITRGPENHWGGVVTGLRYHVDLPKRWNTSVFASWQGGVGGIDSSGQRYAQETDLTFTYLNAIGVRTRVTDALAIDVQLLGQHISNGWQTRPSEGIDCGGFSVAFSYRPGRRR